MNFQLLFFRKYLMEIYICYKIPFRKYLFISSEVLHTCDVMFYGLAAVVMRKLFNTLYRSNAPWPPMNLIS